MRTRLDPSPFVAAQGAPPSVHVAAGQDPYENTRAVLERIDLSAARGRRVLLKPNAGRVAASGSGIVTDARVVAAVIDAFIEAGGDVSVGDSPIAGVRRMAALEATGIADAARQRRVNLLDLDARPYTEIELSGGRAIRSLRVCSEVLEQDLVVSIPVMKTHMHTGVTLSIKNMKGCLWRRSKTDLHMLDRVDGCEDKPLDIAIADMAWALRPHLSVIDGSVGMEGLGPSAGQPKALGVVCASGDPWAADVVACRLMGIEPQGVPHLRLLQSDAGMSADIERIGVEPSHWSDWAGQFERPPEDLRIEFPGVQVLDEQSCSACQSTLLLFLERYGRELREYFPGEEAIHIAIGKGHAHLPRSTLCIGNCTVMHRERGIFVSGCPPVGSAIERLIREVKRER